MPVGAKMVVVFEACVEHGVSLGLAHAVEFVLVVVPETDVFHGSSPYSGLAEPAPERAPARFISSKRSASLLWSRVEKKLAHFAGYIAGDGRPLRPGKCFIQIGGFQYPESAHVLLGLGVRSVGDEHLAVGLLPQRLRVGGRGNAAGELPCAGSD